MHAHTWSVSLFGMEGVPIRITASLLPSESPRTWLDDWPNPSARDTRDRIRAAVRNVGERWPGATVVFAAAPDPSRANLSMHDLALATAVLAAAGRVPADALADTVVLGRLKLDGSVARVNGVLPCLLAARTAGLRKAIVPGSAMTEAALVAGLDVVGVATLGDVVRIINGDRNTDAEGGEPAVTNGGTELVAPDLADAVVPPLVRRAVLAAAAGGHPAMITGTPRLMIGRCLASLLPPLDQDQALELAAIRSLAGALPAGDPLDTRPPYITPHHSTSMPALVGGGSSGKPGAMTLASHGVLHLDDVDQWGPRFWEALRPGMDNGTVTLAAAGYLLRFPARFQLLLSCQESANLRWTPLFIMDRIAIHIPLTSPGGPPSIGGQTEVEGMATAQARVKRARIRAAARWSAGGGITNNDVPAHDLLHATRLPQPAAERLDRLRTGGALTERGIEQILRVAWSLCDLDLLDHPGADQIDEAVMLRAGNRPSL